MLEQDIIELLNKNPAKVWEKIKSEELKISDYEFNVQALFINLCTHYGLVPQVENHFKDNPDFLFKYAKLMGIDLEIHPIFEQVRKIFKEPKNNEVEKIIYSFMYLAKEVFHQELSDDLKKSKFLNIILYGLDFSIESPNKIPEFSKEFEDYMEKECETFFYLFPPKLKINYFSIYKSLIESSTISINLKKRIVSFMLSKQEFYGFSYIRAIEITPELLSFEEIYNNLQVKEIAELLSNLLNQSKTKLISKIRYHKFFELLTPILNEAFKNNPEESNKVFVLKIITAINEDYVTSITGNHDKKKLLYMLRKNLAFDKMFVSELDEQNEIISKILAGESCQIYDRYTLATSKKFIANFDQILRIALNNNDVSRDLISSIAVALINKLKEENGLELEIKITNDNSENNNTYGYYGDTKKIFYLNPKYIQDGNETLVKVIKTIYHEIEHAKQHQQQLPGAKNKITGIDFETYTMILDKFMRQVSISEQYYKDNYDIYSLEVAARREAAKKTSDIVLKHNPSFKELCENLDVKLSPQFKYIRFDAGQSMKQTITKSFIDVVRVIFYLDECFQKKPEYAVLESNLIKVRQLFDDYPFLKNIFYIDIDKHIIEAQPREKIEALLSQASSEFDKDLYREILVDYEILASLKNPEIGITSYDVLPESAKKL